MKSYIQMSIRTKNETADWAIGEKLVESLSLSGGRLLPEQISHNADKFSNNFIDSSSIRDCWAAEEIFDVNGVQSVLYRDFAWRRRRSVKSIGSVVHTFRNLRGQVVPGSISLRASYSDEVDWMVVFRRWCEIFEPQLGMLHLFTAPELHPDNLNDSFQIGSFNSALSPEVPNIGWSMFYGDDFSREVDDERIKSMGFSVESLMGGRLVTVTKEIGDIVADFSLFDRRRAELKRLFRNGFFLVDC
ncbi:hypothetical protein [Stenotrophomonas sp.]|uniref:hypothetical protein n=1 Tax=Stenotrophomonas sp. TaxID=69392 RepID=UPI0028AFA58B|nr:hypothetical protein [Stenotrophomonas sp.]